MPLALVCAFLTSAAAHAQQRDNSLSPVALALWGAVAGAGFGAAFIGPSLPRWSVSDETALLVSVASGLGTGLVAHVAARNLDASVSRRPRLVVTMGNGAGREYEIGYRAPLGNHVELEAAVLVFGDNWSRVERQQRCDAFFGCITGSYEVAHFDQQVVTTVVRSHAHLASGFPLDPTLSIGAGAGRLKVDSDAGASVHTVFPLEIGLAIEGGLRYRWKATVGRRAHIGAVDAATIDNSAWFFRVGVGLGG